MPHPLVHTFVRKLSPCALAALVLLPAVPGQATPPGAEPSRVSCLGGVWVCLLGLLAVTGEPAAGKPALPDAFSNPQRLQEVALDATFDQLQVLLDQWELALSRPAPGGPDLEAAAAWLSQRAELHRQMEAQMVDLKAARRKAVRARVVAVSPKGARPHAKAE